MPEADDFDMFYAATSRRLVGQLFAMTGDMAEAEDAVQEAYIKAWRQWPRVRAYENQEAAVLRAARLTPAEKAALTKEQMTAAQLAALQQAHLSTAQMAALAEALQQQAVKSSAG